MSKYFVKLSTLCWKLQAVVLLRRSCKGCEMKRSCSTTCLPSFLDAQAVKFHDCKPLFPGIALPKIVCRDESIVSDLYREQVTRRLQQEARVGGRVSRQRSCVRAGAAASSARGPLLISVYCLEVIRQGAGSCAY